MGTFIRKMPKIKPFEFEKFEELYKTFVARYEELKAIRQELERFSVTFVDEFQSKSYREFEKACMLITPRQAAIVKVLLLLYEDEEKRKFYELKKQEESESEMSIQLELKPVKSITLARALIDLKISRSKSNAKNYRRTVEKLLKGKVEGKPYSRGSPEIRKLIGKVEGKSLYFPIGFLGEVTRFSFFLKKTCQNIEDILDSLRKETELVIDLYSRLLNFSLKIGDLKREKELIASLSEFESFSSAMRHKEPEVSEEEIKKAYLRAQEIVKAFQQLMEAEEEFANRLMSILKPNVIGKHINELKRTLKIYDKLRWKFSRIKRRVLTVSSSELFDAFRKERNRSIFNVLIHHLDLLVPVINLMMIEVDRAIFRYEFESAWIISTGSANGIKPLVELGEKQTLRFKKGELTKDEYERRMGLLKDIAKKVLMEKKRNIANIEMMIEKEFPM